tara:strand:- start:3894 stop:4151 length:258 start_codon:yes stop_codon:yes gene_type:complete
MFINKAQKKKTQDFFTSVCVCTFLPAVFFSSFAYHFLTSVLSNFAVVFEGFDQTFWGALCLGLAVPLVLVCAFSLFKSISMQEID